MATEDLNQYELIKWFLENNLVSVIQRLPQQFDESTTKLLTLVNERISNMEKALQDKFDAFKAEVVEDNAAKAKVLGEIKATLKKLADALAGASEALAKAKADGFAEGQVALSAEVSAAIDDAKAAVDAGVAATKEMDAQVEDITPEPVPVPPVPPVV